MENQKIALLFTDTNISSGDMARIQAELGKLDHMPTFKVYKNEDGWMAQCNEISGIITGGTETDPSNHIIEAKIREAILAAFNVEVKENPFFSYKMSETAMALA